MSPKKSCLLFLLLTVNVYSQDKDFATIKYGISTLRYNDTSAFAQNAEAKSRFLVTGRNRWIFIGSLAYKSLSFNHFPQAFENCIHGFTLQGISLYKVRSKSSIAFLGQAGLFSDLKDVSKKDFRFSFGIRYRVKYSEKLSLGLGIGYSRQFFGHQIAPFIDLDYKPNNKWSITGQFPIKPKVLYHFSKKLGVGIEISGDASSYRLSATKNDNQFIQVNQWAGLLKLEYRFANSLQLNIGVGRNFRQSFKLYNDKIPSSWTIITFQTSEKEAPVYQIEDKGYIIQLGISFNPF